MQSKPRKVRFTKAAIERLELPETGRVYWYDTEARGPAVCLWPTGKRVFMLYRKIEGKARADQAWRVAGDERGAGPDGGRAIQGTHRGRREPARRKRRSVADAPTLGEMFAEFIEAPTRTKEKRPRSPVTIKGYRYLFEEHLTAWQDRQVSRITRDDIEKMHNRIGEQRPYLANRVLSLLKAVFEFGVEHRLYGTNPGAATAVPKKEQRERFLQANELPKFFEALEAEPSEKVRDFIKVALFTGQRRTNVLSMKWEDVNRRGRRGTRGPRAASRSWWRCPGSRWRS